MIFHCKKHGAILIEDKDPPECPQCATVEILRKELNERRAARGLPPFELGWHKWAPKKLSEDAEK